jgi:enamine deaminase RidA (YjgF/YER057c/UK114 family)
VFIFYFLLYSIHAYSVIATAIVIVGVLLLLLLSYYTSLDQLLLTSSKRSTNGEIDSVGVRERNKMASLQYFERPGPSGKDCIAAGFSNAVVIPANAHIAITAGQAGIDLHTGKLVESSPEAQIEACFDCVDVALKSAGVVDGLASAHKVVSFLTDQRYDPLMMEIWRRRYPGKRPTWMSVGSAALGLKGMTIEFQAEAVIMPGGASSTSAAVGLFIPIPSYSILSPSFPSSLMCSVRYVLI